MLNRTFISFETGLFTVLVSVVFLSERGTAIDSLGPPDFESQWRLIRAQNWGGCMFSFKHKLGEVPQIVDVQIKSLEEPNMNFKFPAIGGCPRDDDIEEEYGSVCYLYNDAEVLVSAPIAMNDFDTGWAIYAANNSYFSGPNNQSSLVVNVKVRAWKESSLPVTGFSKMGTYMNARAPNEWMVYREEEHGFGEYPGLVKVRTKIKDGSYKGYYSDAVGANIVTITSDPTSRPGYVVYGFNDQNIRVWVSTIPKGIIFQGSDGWRIPVKTNYGHLQIFAWRASSIPTAMHNQTQLGPNVENENLEMVLNTTTENVFVQVWAESLSGPNFGYRFPGSGSLAYAKNEQDPVCSYGGLTYSYSIDMLRFWRPNDVNNGGIICISDGFGFGINSQRDLDARVVVSVWTFVTEEITGNPASEWTEIQDVCIHTKL